MKKKQYFNSERFGRLLTPGDKIRITNCWTNTSEERTIDRFDGCEWVFKTPHDKPINNLGHSGYEIETETVFYILINTEHHLKVEILKGVI